MYLLLDCRYIQRKMFLPASSITQKISFNPLSNWIDPITSIERNDECEIVFPIAEGYRGMPPMVLMGSDECCIEDNSTIIKTVDVVSDPDFPGLRKVCERRYLYDRVADRAQLFKFVHRSANGTKVDRYIVPIGVQEQFNTLDPLAHLLVNVLLSLGENKQLTPHTDSVLWDRIAEFYHHIRADFNMVFKLTYDLSEVLNEIKYFCETLNREFNSICWNMSSVYDYQDVLNNLETLIDTMWSYAPSLTNYSQGLERWKNCDQISFSHIGRFVNHDVFPYYFTPVIDTSPCRNLLVVGDHPIDQFTQLNIHSQLQKWLLLYGGKFLNTLEEINLTDAHVCYRSNGSVVSLTVQHALCRYLPYLFDESKRMMTPESMIGYQLWSDFCEFYEKCLGDPNAITKLEIIWNYNDEGLVIIETDEGRGYRGVDKMISLDFNRLSLLAPIVSIDNTPFTMKI